MKIADRVAVVTGGASGIGQACAEALRAAGATVITWDRRGGEIDCDVSEAKSVDRAMLETLRCGDTPTLLVAAAGVASVGSILDTGDEEWDRVMSINVRGVFLAYRAVARQLVATGLEGSMVGIASVQGVIADPLLAAYSASKAAVIHLSRVAAVELGRHGIRVNAVGPGPTRTPMLEPMFDADALYGTTIAAATPLRRVGAPQDIAKGVLGIIECDWITGQAVMLDGGSSLVTARGFSSAEARLSGNGDGSSE